MFDSVANKSCGAEPTYPEISQQGDGGSELRHPEQRRRRALRCNDEIVLQYKAVS